MATKEKEVKSKNGGLTLAQTIKAGLCPLGILLVIKTYETQDEEELNKKFEEDLRELLGVTELPQDALVETHEEFLKNLGLTFDNVDSAVNTASEEDLNPAPIWLNNRERFEKAADGFLAGVFPVLGDEFETDFKNSIEILSGQASSLSKGEEFNLGKVISNIGIQLSEQTESRNISPVTEALTKSLQIKVIYGVIDRVHSK